MAREERATGKGGSELTEDEHMLEDLNEIEDETEKMSVNEEEAKKQRIEKEKRQVLEITERAMDWFGQTRKRIGGGHEGEDQKKKRGRSGEMLEWLKGRIELERGEKEMEQNNKRKEWKIQRLQLTETLQVIQQTQQQVSMDMKLTEQYIQQQVSQQQQQQEQQKQQFNLMQQ